MEENNDKVFEKVFQQKDVKELVDWENPPTVNDLKEDYLQAEPNHTIHVSKVNEFLDDLKAKIKFKPKEGRSKVQPKTIRKYSEWRVASLEEPYLSAKDLFDVVPASAGDVEAARQNKLVLNKQFRIDIPRTKFINDYVRAGNYTGTILCKVGWEVRYGIVREEVEVPDYAQTLEEAIMFLQQMVEAQQIAPEEAEMLLQSGEPIQIGSHLEVQENEKEIVNRPYIEVKDSRNVVIDPSCEGDLRKAKFIIDRFITDMSTLKEDGRYKNLDKIDVTTNDPISDPNYTYTDSSFSFKDKPRQKLVVYEYWGDWDIDGTGIVKPIVATYVGDVMIRLEENPFPFKRPPFVIVPYLPEVDKVVYGTADAYLLKEHQDIIGAVTRGYVDILGRSATGQRGTAKGALDPINKDRYNNGEHFEFNPVGDPRLLFFMETFSEIPRSALEVIQLQNNEAEALTGVKAFNNGVTGNALGSSVGGINRALDATAKREASILNRLSAGLVEIGRMIIAMNSVWLSDEEVIRISDDEFVTIKRDDLAGDFDLVVSVSTADTDNMKAQELVFMLQTLGNSVDFGVLKPILIEIAELRKMPHLAKAIRDYEPQPDPLQQEQLMLQNELLKAQIYNEQAKARENEVDVELKSAKTAETWAKVGKTDADTENKKADTDNKNLDYLQEATGLNQERELEKLQMKGTRRTTEGSTV